jgi:hypothetical protein
MWQLHVEGRRTATVKLCQDFWTLNLGLPECAGLRMRQFPRPLHELHATKWRASSWRAAFCRISNLPCWQTLVPSVQGVGRVRRYKMLKIAVLVVLLLGMADKAASSDRMVSNPTQDACSSAGFQTFPRLYGL